jgi:hypothetical protein
VARDPPETGADGSDWRLHCQDSAESSLVLRHAIVCLRCLCQRVRLHDRFNFSLLYEIKRFVKIFGAVLLAANYSNALRDEIYQPLRMHTERLGLGNSENLKTMRLGGHGERMVVRGHN